MTGRSGKVQKCRCLCKITWKVHVEILIQLLCSSKGEKLQVLKCTQSIKVKSHPLKEISASCFCAKKTEPHLFSTVESPPSVCFILSCLSCHFLSCYVLLHLLLLVMSFGTYFTLCLFWLVTSFKSNGVFCFVICFFYIFFGLVTSFMSCYVFFGLFALLHVFFCFVLFLRGFFVLLHLSCMICTAKYTKELSFYFLLSHLCRSRCWEGDAQFCKIRISNNSPHMH